MPNVLKVFLENGQTKSFKYDSTTKVKDVIASLKHKLCIQRIQHFALVLEQVKSLRRNKLTLLNPEHTIARVSLSIDFILRVGKGTIWRRELLYRRIHIVRIFVIYTPSKMVFWLKNEFPGTKSDYRGIAKTFSLMWKTYLRLVSIHSYEKDVALIEQNLTLKGN